MTSIRKWLAASGLALLAACNPMEELEDADREVARFHRQLDARDFEGIWNASHDNFRAGQPQADYAAFMVAVRDKLGEVEGTEREGFNINTNNGVTTITVAMSTEFAQGPATETFIFLRDGEDLRLLNYNVDSRALVVN